MAYVFRRPWKSWRRDRPHPPFVLPPPAPPVVIPDIVAYGRRPVIAFRGDKKWVFRRPWWNWGGPRWGGILIRGVIPETITVDKWFVALSEPPRRAIGLSSAAQAFFGYVGAAPFGEDVKVASWFVALSEPARKPRGTEGILAAQQRADWFHDRPIIDVSWFVPLSEPARDKIGLRAPQQVAFWYHPFPLAVSMGWFNWLSEPARRAVGLPASLQVSFVTSPAPPTGRPFAYAYVIV